jgi:hypothetical protein
MRLKKSKTSIAVIKTEKLITSDLTTQKRTQKPVNKYSHFVYRFFTIAFVYLLITWPLHDLSHFDAHRTQLVALAARHQNRLVRLRNGRQYLRHRLLLLVQLVFQRFQLGTHLVHFVFQLKLLVTLHLGFADRSDDLVQIVEKEIAVRGGGGGVVDEMRHLKRWDGLLTY